VTGEINKRGGDRIPQATKYCNAGKRRPSTGRCTERVALFKPPREIRLDATEYRSERWRNTESTKPSRTTFSIQPKIAKKSTRMSSGLAKPLNDMKAESVEGRSVRIISCRWTIEGRNNPEGVSLSIRPPDDTRKLWLTKEFLRRKKSELSKQAGRNRSGADSGRWLSDAPEKKQKDRGAGKTIPVF